MNYCALVVNAWYYLMASTLKRTKIFQIMNYIVCVGLRENEHWVTWDIFTWIEANDKYNYYSVAN